MWDAIAKREKLQPGPYEQVVSWGFGDFVFGQGFDMFPTRSRFAKRAYKNASTARRCSPGYSSAFER